MPGFKDIQMVVNQNTLITLKPKSYLLQNPDVTDDCFLKILGMKSLNKSLVTLDEDYLLGDTFLHYIYAVFDYEKYSTNPPMRQMRFGLN